MRAAVLIGFGGVDQLDAQDVEARLISEPGLTCMAFFGPSEAKVTFAVENNSAVMVFKQLWQKMACAPSCR